MILKMILEGMLVATFASAMYTANKASEMDEKALQKYAAAFEKNEEAALYVKEKAEYTDKRLINVAKKKKAIINYTLPQFMEVYGQIQKLEISKSDQTSVAFYHQIQEGTRDIAIDTVLVKKNFTDKELVCGWLVHGLNKMMIEDSERYLSAARSQMRAANVVKEQSLSIGEVYDAIVARADRIADLLVKMNPLFIRSVQETKRVIEKNGTDINNYSTMEKGVLMNCINIASAVSDIINVPVVDEQGKISEQAEAMVKIGESKIKELEQIMEER